MRRTAGRLLLLFSSLFLLVSFLPAQGQICFPDKAIGGNGSGYGYWPEPGNPIPPKFDPPIPSNPSARGPATPRDTRPPAPSATVLRELTEDFIGTDSGSGQSLALLNPFDLTQVSTDISAPIALWYTSQSNTYAGGPAAEYPEWPRPFTAWFRGPWDECLVGPKPGDPVTRVCPFGLAITTSVPPDPAMKRTRKVTTKSGALTVDEYCYQPAPDGTRLIYEMPPGAEHGIWFREFPDGSRVEYEQAEGSQDYRINRFYRGAWASPDWEVVYHWGSGNKLWKITDTRGLEYVFNWDASLTHVIRIDVGWPGKAVETSLWFHYNANGLLDRIVYPKRSMTYDWTHDGDYQDADEVLEAYPALEFGYGASTGRITTFKLAYFQNPTDKDHIGSCVEDRLRITYQSDPAWRVEKIDRPGKDGSTWLTDHFSYQTNPDAVIWTDPLEVVRKYEWVKWSPYSNNLLERSIVKVTHTAPSTDPRVQDGYYAHQTLHWTFTWDHLRMLSMEGPTEEGKSTPQPFRVDWTYDDEGRGLLTSMKVTPEGDGTAPSLTRTWTWTDWGSPWEDPDQAWLIRGVSRLTGYTDAAGRTITLSYDLQPDYVTTSISYPETGSSEILEDSLGRVLSMEEPGFQAVQGGQSGTSRGTVEFEYNDSSPGTAGYRLVSRVIRYRGLDQTDPVKTEFHYTGLGLVQEVVVLPYHQDLTRHFWLEYDGAGQVVKTWLPDPVTGGVDTNNLPDLHAEWDPFGRVVRFQRHAQYMDNGILKEYPNSWIQRTLYYDYGGRISRAVVERAPMDTQSDPNNPDHWLTYQWEWDKGDRLSRFLGPVQGDDASHEVDMVWDTFGYPYKIKRLLKGATSSSKSTASIQEWAERKYGFRALGALAEAVDATGFVRDFDSDGFGRLTRVRWKGTDGSGNKSLEVKLGPEGLVQEVYFWKSPGGSDQLLKKWVFTRDGLGRVTRREIYENGNTSPVDWEEWTYTGLFYPLTLRDKNGRGRDWSWDPLGLLAKVEDTLSAAHKNALQVERDAAGNVTTLTEIAQKETSWGSYAQNPTQYVTKFLYDHRSRMTARESWGTNTGALSKREYTLDSLDRLVKAQDFAKDGSGSLAARKWVEFSYDALGRELRRKIFPTGGNAGSEVTLTTHYVDLPPASGGGLDPNLGFLLEKVDDEGHMTSYLFDRGGRLWKRRVPGYQDESTHHQWVYTRDKEGRLTSWTDGNGTQVSILYDSLMRPTQWYGVQGAWTLSAMTVKEKFTYDDFDRVTSVQTLFNDWSNPVNLVKAGAVFDLLGRIQQESYQWRGMDASAAKILASGWVDTGFRRSLGYSTGWNFQFTPDGAGKLAEMKIEAPGAGSFSELGKWRYEGNMVLGRRIYRDGSNFLEEALTRNKLGMLTGIDVDGGSTLHEEIRRDWLGNVLAVKYPRPEMVGNKSQQEQACGDAFELDGFDRLIGAKLGIKASDWGKDYGQITQWGDRKLAYALDKVHNRDQVDTWDSGNTQTTDTYTQESGSNRYAGVNQSSLTYDDNGNLVWDGVLGQMYVYDYLDRLCEVWRPYSTGAQLKSKGGFTQKEIRDLSAELHKGLDLAKVMDSGTGTVKTESGWELIAYYGYDPWNRKAYRSAKYEGTFVYTWDGWKRAEEYEETYDGKSYTYTPTRVFFDGAGIDEHLGYAYTSDGGANWTRYTYLLGHQGTVRAVLDANGAVQERYLYDPYGKRRVYAADWTPRSATQVHNDYGYTGRTHDPAIGLLYYRNRWYHPSLGRFLSYDPIGLWGDPTNWGSGYAGFGSAAIDSSDPFGLYTVTIIDLPEKDKNYKNVMRRAEEGAKTDPEGGAIFYRNKDGQWEKKEVDFDPENDIRKEIERANKWIGKYSKDIERLEKLDKEGFLSKRKKIKLSSLKKKLEKWKRYKKDKLAVENRHLGIVHVEVFGHGFHYKGEEDGFYDMSNIFAILCSIEWAFAKQKGKPSWIVIGACFQGNVPKGKRSENLASRIADYFGIPVEAFTWECTFDELLGPVRPALDEYRLKWGKAVMVDPAKKKK